MPTKKQHRGQRRPYLRLHGVAESADETLDAQWLLEVAEEYLYSPPRLVKCGYGGGGKCEVVGEQFFHKAVFFVPHGDSQMAKCQKSCLNNNKNGREWPLSH